MASSRILIFLTLTLNLIFTPNLVLDSISSKMEKLVSRKIGFLLENNFFAENLAFFRIPYVENKMRKCYFSPQNFVFFLRKLFLETLIFDLLHSLDVDIGFALDLNHDLDLDLDLDLEFTSSLYGFSNRCKLRAQWSNGRRLKST